jgi:hypothetical protein
MTLVIYDLYYVVDVICLLYLAQELYTFPVSIFFHNFLVELKA